MRVAALLCLAACGRFGFDGESATDGGGSGSVDAISTGSAGPRWIRRFSDQGSSSAVGKNGEVAVFARMAATFSADPTVSLACNGFVATAFVRYDALGSVTSSTIFDSNGFCDLRQGVLDGDDIVAAGLTGGTATIPAYGACSIVTNRQDPVAIRIDPAGQQSLVMHWLAGGANAQAWSLALMPDHTFTLGGIYGSGLTIGSTALPTGITDPSMWAARNGLASTTAAAWAKGYTAGVDIHAGPIAAAGDEICMLGSHHGAATVFGQALPNVGGYDVWVARIDGTGTPRFVRAVGSTADEPDFGVGSVLALADGSCIAGTFAKADVTIDGIPFPRSDGEGLAFQLASDGTLVWGRRFQAIPELTYVGNRLIAAYSVTVPVAVGATMYTPMGSDVVIVEVSPTNPANDRLLGVVAGAGNQAVAEVVAVGPDAVAVTVTSNGELTFGATTVDTSGGLRAVGVLGI